MEKFLVLHRVPNPVIDEWMKKPEQERKVEETKDDGRVEKVDGHEWQQTRRQGCRRQPKVVSSSGVKDGRNDIMTYQIVQATSADEGAKMVVDHAHFGIPQASIELMPLKVMEG